MVSVCACERGPGGGKRKERGEREGAGGECSASLLGSGFCFVLDL